MTTIVTMLVVAMLAGGCAMGHGYAYHTVVANPTIAGTGAVAVAAHDQRTEVLAGRKAPQFVGVVRGDYGNPFDVRTVDDRPLAEDMTTALANTLGRKGFRTRPIVVAHSVSPADVRQRVVGAGTDRAIVLTLKTWRSDTLMRIGLSYDVTMTVLDRTGRTLAEKRLAADQEMLGSAGFLGGRRWEAGDVVGAAFKTRLEQLLDDPAISAALRGGV